jgi:RNA polymerase sigma-70 factor (ECF subfamily)
MRVRLRLVERDDRLGTDAGVRAAVQAHSGELYGFAFRALGDQGLAEEVVQETFVRAWRAGRRFDPDIASLRTWLFAILRNVIIDATRARSVRPGVAVAVDVAIADNIDELMQSWVVEEALRRLTDQHRRAVVEVYYQGRSAVDVAAELGVPAATIRSRLFYGLRALRLALDELGWDDA